MLRCVACRCQRCFCLIISFDAAMHTISQCEVATIAAELAALSPECFPRCHLLPVYAFVVSLMPAPPCYDAFFAGHVILLHDIAAITLRLHITTPFSRHAALMPLQPCCRHDAAAAAAADAPCCRRCCYAFASRYYSPPYFHYAMIFIPLAQVPRFTLMQPIAA